MKIWSDSLSCSGIREANDDDNNDDDSYKDQIDGESIKIVGS